MMMKLKHNVKFDVIVASHMGMCFGVKAAIKNAQNLARKTDITVLGELAHNTSVKKTMEAHGARHGSLSDTSASTRDVIITAHGASDTMRNKWQNLGYRLTDTTCPLVHKTHTALRQLVEKGYMPLVIGKADHVEVRGLMGDFPTAQSVLTIDDVEKLKRIDILHQSDFKIGVVSQTTQQIDHCERIVMALRRKFQDSEILFIDTVCRPTKDRQSALLELCSKVKLIIVVGGTNSNNTAQLAKKCRKLGCVSHHIQSSKDLRTEWFEHVDKVGLTAGTSTPDSQIESVKQRLLEISRS